MTAPSFPEEGRLGRGRPASASARGAFSVPELAWSEIWRSRNVVVVRDITPALREPNPGPEKSPPPKPSKSRQRRPLVPVFFLHVRGPLRGAVVEKTERINKKTIRVRLVDG